MELVSPCEKLDTSRGNEEEKTEDDELNMVNNKIDDLVIIMVYVAQYLPLTGVTKQILSILQNLYLNLKNKKLLGPDKLAFFVEKIENYIKYYPLNFKQKYKTLQNGSKNHDL